MEKWMKVFTSGLVCEKKSNAAGCGRLLPQKSSFSKAPTRYKSDSAGPLSPPRRRRPVVAAAPNRSPMSQLLRNS